MKTNFKPRWLEREAPAHTEINGTKTSANAQKRTTEDSASVPAQSLLWAISLSWGHSQQQHVACDSVREKNCVHAFCVLSNEAEDL